MELAQLAKAREPAEVSALAGAAWDEDGAATAVSDAGDLFLPKTNWPP